MNSLTEKKRCKQNHKKNIQKEMKEIKEMAKSITHICEKCGRFSNVKKTLCKPILVREREV